MILNLAARLPLWSARTVALSTVGLLTIATVGGAALWALTLRQTALEARQELASVREVLAPQPSDEGPRAPAGERFQRACAAAGSAQTALRKVGSQVGVLTPIVGALDLLPGGVGARARAQTTALDAGAQLADLGVTLCHDLQPIGTLLGGSDGAPGSTAESLRALVASRASLVETADRLEKLQGSLGELDREDVPGVSPGELARLREKLPTTAQMLRDSASLLGLFGGDRPRRLLIVSQNPDELRPTGGYIGSAGVVEIKDGVVRLVEYGSSRAYDTPATMRAIPPAPYQPYLGTGYWHMAGANWEPSFPDVARQLEYFFTLSHPGQSLDGAVAVDQVALARLLEVLGPVEVPEYGETVGAADVQAALDRHLHAANATSDPDEGRRKQFTGALTAAVLRRALGAPGDQLPGLAKSVRAALDQQHLLVWLKDPEAGRLFGRKHWDGRLLDYRGDYLMLVDTEVTSSKHSQDVRRDAEYRVEDAEGDPRATLTVTYRNGTDPTKRPNVRFVERYRSFFRAYAPAGARLIEAEGFDGPPTSYGFCDRAVFGGRITIPAGQTVRVRLTYALPTPAAGYDFVLQQQPGVPPGSVRVSLPGADPVELANEPGRHAHLQLAGGALASAPLPEGGRPDCGSAIVAAEPLTTPAWLEVSSLKVRAPVVELGIGKDGLMEAPTEPNSVGWYRMSARAGAPGNSVISGHVDSRQGPAVFWDLAKLQPDQEIVVEGADG
ncbi:MAG TPA: DUF4012 domain-containing protein, partial [Chloroflexota bacterium]